jgi:hypothetical protein
VLTGTINDNNGHSWTSRYYYGAVANNEMTNVVTDPLGNDTVHVFTALNGVCRSSMKRSRVTIREGRPGGRSCNINDFRFALNFHDNAVTVDLIERTADVTVSFSGTMKGN